MTKKRVKIQRPIFGNDQDDPWLMYFESGKSPTVQIPVRNIPKNLKKAMGKNCKIYVKGEYDVGNNIFIFTDEDIKNAELI